MNRIMPAGRTEALHVLGILLITCVGCREFGSSGPAVVVADSAGIEIVDNRRPVVSGILPWVVDTIPSLQIGVESGEEAYEFGWLWDAKRSVDGNIAAVDALAREVRVFDATGAHLVTIGREGYGPGDFGANPFIAWNRDGDLVAWDPRTRMVSWFDLTGALLRQRSLVDEISAARIRVPGNSASGWRIFPDGSLIAFGLDTRQPEAGHLEFWSQVFVLPPNAGPTLNLGEYLCDEAVSTSTVIAVNHPFGHCPRAVLSGDFSQVLLLGSPSWEITSFGRDGSISRLIRAAIQRKPVLQAAIDSHLDRYRVQAEERQVSPRVFFDAFERLNLPDSLPGIASIRTDSRGYIWAGYRSQPAADQQGYYEVFDPEGRWFGTARLPQQIGSIAEIGEDYILTIWRDERGIYYIRVHRFSVS